MLAGYIENIFSAGRLQDLVDAVKLLRFGKVADVSGMQDEAWLGGQSIDLIHGYLQRSRDIRIGRLVEAHMAVTDLDKAQLALGLLFAEFAQTAETV